MIELKLNVEGMVCGGCENRVKNALGLLDGVKEVDADFKTGEVVIKSEREIEKSIIEEKIRDLGFEVK